jgi:anti-anti-sigma regulatory factor
MMLEHEGLFRVEVTPLGGGSYELRLRGELDLTTISAFQRDLAEVLSSRPSKLTFDLRAAQFISVQGYAAIRRCSLEVGRVTIRSTSNLAERVMHILGQHDLTFVAEISP